MEGLWAGALQLRDFLAEGLSNCLGDKPELAATLAGEVEGGALRENELLGGIFEGHVAFSGPPCEVLRWRRTGR